MRGAGRGTVFFKFISARTPSARTAAKTSICRTSRGGPSASSSKPSAGGSILSPQSTTPTTRRSGMSTASFLCAVGSPESTSGYCRKSPGPSRHASLSFSARPGTSSAPVPAIKCSAASGERSSAAGEGEALRRCSPAAATADLENSQAFRATARTARSATQA